MNLITYKKTVVGWYNFTSTIMRYNIDPTTFRRITGTSEQASMGTCEVTAEELDELKAEATFLGLADGWKWIPSDDKEVS